MGYEVKEIKSKLVWERFVLSRKPKSFLHSWNWGETHKVLGEKVFRIGYYEGNSLKGVCLLMKQSAKRGPHFLVPGGPLLDWGNEKLVDFFVESTKRLAKKEKVWFVRVRPELLDTDKNKHLFKLLGFVSAPMHLDAENTSILDVIRTEDEILSSMRKNTRYSVKKSLKAGLTVETTTDVSALDILNKLQSETVERHGFVGFSAKLFKAQMESFGPDNQAKLFVVRHGKLPLAAAIIVFFGEYAYYHFSGSSNKYREIPSSYFLQWNVIKEAKKRKLKGYNLWGIAPEGKDNHRFSGVTTFKTGFGGERTDWLHAHDLVISPMYWITHAFEKVRKLSRGL